MNSVLTEQVKILKAIDPSADVFAGGVDSDVFNMKGYGRIAFIVAAKSASTGVGTFTVKACTDVSKTSPEALPFLQRKIADGATEAMTALTAVASTGVACTASAYELHVIEVAAADLPQTKNFIYLSVAETVDAAIVGAAIAVLYEPRSVSDQPTIAGLS